MPNTSTLIQINPSTNLDLVPIYQPQPDHSGFITTLKASINIKSIAHANFIYIPDSTPPESVNAILEEFSETLEYKEISVLLKKGNGSWVEKNKIRLFNKDPYYEVDLMAYLTDANTVDVAEDLAIGLRMNEALVDADYITIFGFAVEEKKTDDLEAALARIEALELALHGRITGLEADQFLGSGASGGIAVQIPQSHFINTTSNQNNIGGEKTFTDDVRCESLFFSAGGLIISATTPNELDTGYGFIRHNSGPLLFYIGNAAPFIFKNGNGAPGNLITINQDATISYMQSIPAGSGTTCVFSAGKIIALSSSREFKENIRPLEVRQDILNLINPVTFNYKEQDPIEQVTHGFVVEDIEAVEPSLVTYEEGKAYSIQHSEIIAVLWREVQKISSELQELKQHQ